MLALLGRTGLILLLLGASPLQAAVSLTTMNIRFYGLNAEENREPELIRYLDDNALWSDVMVFQEIVDVARLQEKVVGFGYTCVSYASEASGHQHVVVCHKPTLRFEKAADDDDFILENVAMGSTMYRPAVHGILRTASGSRIAHLVAVHLKAMPEDGAKRIEQMHMIHDYLAFERSDSLPAILVGDTNLFDDDVDAVTEILTDDDLGLKAVATPGRYTYRVPELGQKFDRVWLGEGLSVQGAARVAGPCNLSGPAGEAKIRVFNKAVSDHCAVVLQVVLSVR